MQKRENSADLLSEISNYNRQEWFESLYTFQSMIMATQ